MEKRNGSDIQFTFLPIDRDRHHNEREVAYGIAEHVSSELINVRGVQ